MIPLGNLTGTYRASMAQRVRIGRGPDNDVVVNDLLVSRHHAEVVLSAERGYEIVDLKSHNGTFVDGQRVTASRIDEASVIGFGHHQFRLVGGALELYEDAGRVEFEASNLSVFVTGRRPILDEVSFVLPPNCFLAIVGPSGAGKSTLMKALTGFQPSEEGSVLYGGQDLYTHLEELRPRIGYVPQDDVLHPQLTVRRLARGAPPEGRRGDGRTRARPSRRSPYRQTLRRSAQAHERRPRAHDQAVAALPRRADVGA
jgi:ABC-type multidrug transport system fused ATPase/permease subunit